MTRFVLDSPRVALFTPTPRALAFLAAAALVIVLSALSFRWVERPFLRRAVA